MSASLAANVLAGVIFVTFIYVLRFRASNGRWPKVRNPFY